MSKEKRPVINMYTDGSFKKRVGGYAGVMVSGNHCIALAGSDPTAPDNDRMELQAVVSCMRQINTPSRIHLTSDSQYVVNGINKWMNGWKRNDWKTHTGKPCAYQDLWKELAELRKAHLMKAEWVKGHQSNPTTPQQIANTVCDELAQSAADNCAHRKG